jgi:hypothetical protein
VGEGLMMRRKRRKRLVRERVNELRLTGTNQEWAMDFIVDGLATGRMVRVLRVVDVYSHDQFRAIFGTSSTLTTSQEKSKTSVVSLPTNTSANSGNLNSKYLLSIPSIKCRNQTPS